MIAGPKTLASVSYTDINELFRPEKNRGFLHSSIYLKTWKTSLSTELMGRPYFITLIRIKTGNRKQITEAQL